MERPSPFPGHQAGHDGRPMYLPIASPKKRHISLYVCFWLSNFMTFSVNFFCMVFFYSRLFHFLVLLIHFTAYIKIISENPWRDAQERKENRAALCWPEPRQVFRFLPIRKACFLLPLSPTPFMHRLHFSRSVCSVLSKKIIRFRFADSILASRICAKWRCCCLWFRLEIVHYARSSPLRRCV